MRRQRHLSGGGWGHHVKQGIIAAAASAAAAALAATALGLVKLRPSALYESRRMIAETLSRPTASITEAPVGLTRSLFRLHLLRVFTDE